MTAVLTVAGSDPGGGAGLQADLKTFQAHGVYGCAVVTALTVQDTTGVHAVEPVAPELVAAQLEAVLADLDVRAAKVGMLGTAAVARAVARVWSERRRARPPLVLDTVRCATAGAALVDDDGWQVLRAELLPLAELVAPNLAEAAALTGLEVTDLASMEAAARELVRLGARAALVTGGHLDAPVVRDVLCVEDEVRVLEHPRVTSAPDFHGTGCALTAAVAANLAAGRSLEDSVVRARRFVHAAIAGAVPRGRGALPVDPTAGARALSEED